MEGYTPCVCCLCVSVRVREYGGGGIKKGRNTLKSRFADPPLDGPTGPWLRPEPPTRPRQLLPPGAVPVLARVMRPSDSVHFWITESRHCADFGFP